MLLVVTHDLPLWVHGPREPVGGLVDRVRVPAVLFGEQADQREEPSLPTPARRPERFEFRA